MVIKLNIVDWKFVYLHLLFFYNFKQDFYFTKVIHNLCSNVDNFIVFLTLNDCFCMVYPPKNGGLVRICGKLSYILLKIKLIF